MLEMFDKKFLWMSLGGLLPIIIGLMFIFRGKKGFTFAYYMALVSSITWPVVMTSAIAFDFASLALTAIKIKFLLLLSLMNILVVIFSGREQIYNVKVSIFSNFLFLGCVFLLAANRWTTLVISLQIISLTNYFLLALSPDANSSGASVRFFILDQIANAFLIFAIALLLGATSGPGWTNLTIKNEQLYQLGLLLVLIFFLFKIGILPFHQWLMQFNIFSGSAGIFSFFTMAQTAICFCFLGLINSLLVEVDDRIQDKFLLLCNTLAVLCVVGGNLLAIAEKEFKKSYAYALIGIAAPVLVSLNFSIQNQWPEIVLYLFFYSFTSASCLLLINDFFKYGSEEVNPLSGLFYQDRFKGTLLLIVWVSLIGTPFTLGFSSRYMLLAVLAREGHYITVALLVFGIIFGAYFFGKQLIGLFFYGPSAGLHEKKVQISINKNFVYIIIAIITIILGVMPKGLFNQFLVATQ
jgi:NADH-quinone oxidoreductase subunit N